MKKLKIEKGKLACFLEELRKEFRVVAPANEDGLVLFAEIGSGSEAVLDFGNSRQSPKGFFFPQADVLLSYQSQKGELKVDEPSPEPRKTVIFGMRPCDARAVLLLDKVFLNSDYTDANYLSRRNNTFILTLGCTRPRSTCFCASLGGGPSSTEGADALFSDVGQSYVIEVLTPKGEELFKRLTLSEADKGDLKLVEESKNRAEAMLGAKVAAKRAGSLELPEVFESAFWDKVQEKCLGCGICTYLCPTCSCFDVVDEKSHAGGERIRIWDTCLYPLYAMQASGFNPRPTGKERMRQKILCKFKYSVASRGEASCVGCGRCVMNCPVNLDIREAVNNLVGGKV
jgi:ferredoxin